jgi:hypothetical protein
MMMKMKEVKILMLLWKEEDPNKEIKTLLLDQE